MAPNSSISSLSFRSTTSESSAYSSPCSSPSSLPLLPSPCGCKLSVPFLWEEKPGITKPTPSSSSSSSLKSCTSIPTHHFYGSSLDLPPLPPPPCLLSSQPRNIEIKPLHASHSLITRRPHDAKPSKEDPFFLALQACTKVDKKDASRERKASFDGLPTALCIFKPTMRSKERGKARSFETDSAHHHTRRDVRKELRFNGESNGRGKLADVSSIRGVLHALFSMEDRASRVETRGPNLHTLMLEKDEEITKKGHHQMNAGGKATSSGCAMSVGDASRGKKDGPIQGLHGREVPGDGQIKHKHKDAKAKARENNNDALHSKAKHSAHVVRFNYCAGFIKYRDNDASHHASKLNVLGDMFGCKPLPPLNGAAIHPYLSFHDKLLSRPR